MVEKIEILQEKLEQLEQKKQQNIQARNDLLEKKFGG